MTLLGVCLTVKLREPEISDADALGQVHVDAWRQAYRGGLMPDEYLDGLDADDRAQMWRDGLERSPRRRAGRFVAEDDDGTVVGFITVGPADGDDAEIGEVYALNVSPEAWGKGYGQALLRSGVRALTDAGFDRAVLWVHPGNERACRFYERAGWQNEGQQREQDVLGVVVPEVRYQRRL